jgi:hypothetical protein
VTISVSPLAYGVPTTAIWVAMVGSDGAPASWSTWSGLDFGDPLNSV